MDEENIKEDKDSQEDAPKDAPEELPKVNNSVVDQPETLTCGQHCSDIFKTNRCSDIFLYPNWTPCVKQQATKSSNEPISVIPRPSSNTNDVSSPIQNEFGLPSAGGMKPVESILNPCAEHISEPSSKFTPESTTDNCPKPSTGNLRELLESISKPSADQMVKASWEHTPDSSSMPLVESFEMLESKPSVERMMKASSSDTKKIHPTEENKKKKISMGNNLGTEGSDGMNNSSEPIKKGRCCTIS